MRWQPMGTAPRDGSWVRGRNAEGREATIQFRNALAGIRGAEGLGSWFEGNPEPEGHWVRNACFYPTGWKPIAINKPADSPK